MNYEIKKILNIKDYNDKKIILSFVILRFIATCLITNTHYNDVYPIKSLAVGGLLGDVLFFIVSGFVLACSTEQKFLTWYWRRVIRIYPTIIVGVFIYIVTDYQTLGDFSLFEAFIFPTFFVFTAAIILLYIPFYFVNKIDNKKEYFTVFVVWILLWVFTYSFFFDKTTYEMNNTWNPMILFLYFSGMLIGAYIRKFGIKKIKNTEIIINFMISLFFLVLYFITTKIIRVNYELYQFQIVVQITLLIGISFFVYAVYLLDDWFKIWPSSILKFINFIAGLTLEIYVVQKPVIKAFSNITFPINWLIITGLIIFFATILRITINIIVTFVNCGITKFKKERTNI